MKLTLLIALVLFLVSCSPKTHTLSGEVFATLKDGQSRKFGGVGIWIYTKAIADERGVEYQSDAAHHTIANSDGKFSIKLPPGKYQIVAQAGEHNVYDANRPAGERMSKEPFRWNVSVDLKKDETITLHYSE